MDDRILDILTAIRDTYGDAIFYNITTTKNLLADLAPRMQKERIQIAHFLEMGGYFPLKYAEKDYEVVRTRLTEQFITTFSVTRQVADWVLDIFSVLCGIDLEAEKNAYKPPPEPTGKPLMGDNPPRKKKPKKKKTALTQLADHAKQLLGEPETKAAATVTAKPKPVIAKPAFHPMPTPAPVLAVYSKPAIAVPLTANIPPLPPAARFTADYHTVAITRDGFVKAAGPNTDGQCNTITYGWRDMAQVSAGGYFTVGLRNDGTLIGTGREDFGQRDFVGWREVVQVSAGVRHTAAVRADGTCLAVGQNKHGECNVRHWRNIVKIIAGNACTFGIKKDGRVLVAGKNEHGDLQVSHLNNVADIAYAGPGRAIALLNDGRIARVGQENHMRRSFTLHRDVKAIAAAPDYFAGLMENGTVKLLAYFWNDCGTEAATADWRGITAINAGRYHILGLQGKRLIGAMLHPDVSRNKGQLDISDWEM